MNQSGKNVESKDSEITLDPLETIRDVSCENSISAPRQQDSQLTTSTIRTLKESKDNNSSDLVDLEDILRAEDPDKLARKFNKTTSGGSNASNRTTVIKIADSKGKRASLSNPIFSTPPQASPLQKTGSGSSSNLNSNSSMANGSGTIKKTDSLLRMLGVQSASKTNLFAPPQAAPAPSAPEAGMSTGINHFFV